MLPIFPLLFHLLHLQPLPMDHQQMHLHLLQNRYFDGALAIRPAGTR